MSASESICAPNFEVAFSIRARRPSMPSRKAASSTITTAGLEAALEGRSRMPDRPAQIASTVIRLGSIMRSGISRMRGPPLAMRLERLERRAHRSGDPHRGACRRRRRIRPAPSRRRPPSGRRRRAAWRSSGRKTSTREPKRIRPKRSPAPIVAAGLGPADDAARHQAGDLHDGDRAVRALDDQAVALVLVAGLVEFGIEELARPMLDPGDAAAHRARGSHGRKRRS